MGRYIGALGLVAQVAQVALLDDAAIVGLVHTVHFQRFRLVDQIEQGREGVAQTDTAAASVADIEDTLQFGIQRGLVVEVGIGPSQRMAGRRLQVAFAGGIGGVSHDCCSGIKVPMAAARRFVAQAVSGWP